MVHCLGSWACFFKPSHSSCLVEHRKLLGREFWRWPYGRLEDNRANSVHTGDCAKSVSRTLQNGRHPSGSGACIFDIQLYRQTVPCQ
jgi:hypothetical protein